MPFLLEDRDVTGELAGAQSALIVPCRFCPAASLAVRTTQAPITRWPALLEAWLGSIGIIWE